MLGLITPAVRAKLFAGQGAEWRPGARMPGHGKHTVAGRAHGRELRFGACVAQGRLALRRTRFGAARGPSARPCVVEVDTETVEVGVRIVVVHTCGAWRVAPWPDSMFGLRPAGCTCGCALAPMAIEAILT